MFNRFKDELLEAGCDESGAGCGFGPVFAACVILPPEFSHPLIKDSKKLSEKRRNEAYDIIIKNAISYSIESVENDIIDDINILQSRFLAMDKSIKSMNVKPNFLIIDGNMFYKNYVIDYECIVKGDSKYTSIAAASILAKVERDNYILSISKEYKNWLLEKNKGYLTKEHIESIKKYGLSDKHRKTFCKKFTI